VLVVLAAAALVLVLRVPVVQADAAVLGNLVGREDTTASDEDRELLLEAATSRIDAGSLALGTGARLDRAPHNVFLEVLVVGGITAFGGLLLVMWTPLSLLVRRRVGVPPLESAAALAMLGFFVAVFFNNALWAPFAWCGLAFLVHRRPEREAVGAGVAPPRTPTTP
jgi:hypothetical protein